MQDVTLINIAEGEAQHLFQRELERALENIADPHTSATAARDINLKVRIIPNQERDFAKVEITVSSKLVATAGRSSPVFMGMEEDGQGQMRLVMRQQDVAQKELGIE